MTGRLRHHPRAVLVAVVLGSLTLLGAVGTVSEPATASSVPSGSAAVGSVTAAVPSPHYPTPIHHVFLILMENEQTGLVYGPQPYQTGLANTYAWGGNANGNTSGVGYYAVCHPSAPNYLALTSGQSLECGSDAWHNYSVNNLGHELDTARESWIGYEESASVPCQEYNSGLYVIRHNPFPYYGDLGGNHSGSVCVTHDVPIANLTDDYPYNSTPPNFTYIAPNLHDDGHSSSARYADNWLSTFIPKLMAAPWFSSSIIFITYDEAYEPGGADNSTGYDGLTGGPVYTVAVSPYTKGVGALDVNTSHYNLLSTMEWLLGLPPTGTGLDQTPDFPVMVGLFNRTVFGPHVRLTGSDLEHVDLAGYDLQGDNLRGANLSGANLTGADLNGADLRSANLTGANLQGATLKHADLAGAMLSNSTVRGADFQDAQLQDANLSGAVLTGLGPARAQWTDFDGADFNQSYLGGAVCARPNYIVAVGADLNAIQVPALCRPPL